MKRFHEYDVVVLRCDLPEYNLKKGQIGAVVLVYDSTPLEYEVEFCDNEGITLALLNLQEEFLEEAK